MAHIELNLDPFVKLWGQSNDGFSLPALSAIAHLTGVNGMSLTIDGAHIKLTERDIEVIFATMGKIRKGVHITPRSDMVQLAIDLNMDVVTFFANDLFDSYGDDLKIFIPRLKEAGILTSIKIDSSMDQLKKAYRLKPNYVEISTRDITSAKTAEEEIAHFNLFEKLAKTAENNNLGVSASGGINAVNILPLANMDAIENFIIGEGILTRALFVGLDKAIHDLKDAVL